MIATARSPRRPHRPPPAKRVVTGQFDGFLPEEGEDNERLRQRYRMLLLYGCEHCLSAAEQQVVQGYYREGKSLVRLSAEWGISPSALSRRLKSARQKLLTLTEQADVIRQICSITEQ